TISGTASDTNLVSVEVSIDGGAYALATGTSSWSFNAVGLGDGPHTIDARATDSATNVGTATQVSVTVDTANPSVTITSPANGAFLNTGSFLISGTASDTNLASVEVSIDGGAYALATGTSSWTFNAVGLGDGPHTIDARATDSATNVGTATQVSVTVDTANPTVTI